MVRCPRTAAEAWKRLDKRLSKEEKKAIREAEDMVDFHFSLGMWIRNYWIYTGERENLESLMKDLGEPEHLMGDMASSAILDAYQNHLRELKCIDKEYEFESTGFDYVNPEAEVVLVGITPGNSQQKGSREGMSPREIKQKYAFAGTLRTNMVRMLDYIGVNTMMGICSCTSLWKEDFDRVEMTSLLKDATYIKGKNGRTMFKDTEMIAKSKELTGKFENGFVKDCQQYKKARLFVACGQGVYVELKKLKERGVIKVPVVAIAHPSGNNSIRVLYYMDELDSSLVWCKEMAKEAKDIIRKTR